MTAVTGCRSAQRHSLRGAHQLSGNFRLAYAEIRDDETAATATAVPRSAVAWFAVRYVIVERVHSDNGSCYRTLADGRAFCRFYPTETARRNALPGWLHEYNRRPPHTAIGNTPHVNRLTNLPGQYT